MAGVGKTPLSWKKHDLCWQVIRAQAASYHVKHPGPWLILDMHAGDGLGIQKPQLDFFQANTSLSTPEMAVRLASEIGEAEVILCEKNREVRTTLSARFPHARILSNHTKVVPFLAKRYGWALVLNDPNGYSGHGVDTMRQIAATMPADFVIVFNEGMLERHMGMRDDHDWSKATHSRFIENVRAAKTKYAWMLEPQAWGRALGRRYVARSWRTNASAGMRYRLLVVSNSFSRVVQPPRWEIFAC